MIDKNLREYYNIHHNVILSPCTVLGERNGKYTLHLNLTLTMSYLLISN